MIFRAMTKRDTRSAILEAAIEIMGTEGYEGLTASRLAAAASISKANLFHHFRTLDDVPIAAFEVIANQIVAAPLPENGTAHDFIAAMGEVALATLADRRGFYAAYVSFLTRAVFDPRLHESVRASLIRSKAEVQRAIAARIGDDATARKLTDLTLVIMDGAMLHILLIDNQEDIRAMWDHYLTLIATAR